MIGLVGGFLISKLLLSLYLKIHFQISHSTSHVTEPCWSPETVESERLLWWEWLLICGHMREHWISITRSQMPISCHRDHIFRLEDCLWSSNLFSQQRKTARILKKMVRFVTIRIEFKLLVQVKLFKFSMSWSWDIWFKLLEVYMIMLILNG